jgi:ParB/RepB/Spo0J family partition protein
MTIKNTKDVQISMISVDSVIAGPNKMRSNITAENTRELRDSIRENGLIHPIAVTQDGGKYNLVSGERRLFAFRALGEPEIPAIIFSLTYEGIMQIRYAENQARTQIEPYDEAKFLQGIKERLGINSKQLAHMIQKSDAYVSDRLAILSYSTSLRNAMTDGHISFSTAREFAKEKDVEFLNYYLPYAVANGCSPDTARQWVKMYQSAKSASSHDPTEYLIPGERLQMPETKTQGKCFFCESYFDYPDLQTVNICRTCISDLPT